MTVLMLGHVCCFLGPSLESLGGGSPGSVGEPDVVAAGPA